MAWLNGNSTVELDNKITEATSESIPNGEVELLVALEISDIIRSKSIPAKQCMRALKKRLSLIASNPNLVCSSLRLVDVCVKNGGYHFLQEIASQEFVDFYESVLLKTHYNVKDDKLVLQNPSKLAVLNLILSSMKEWSIAFKGQLQLSNVEKCYRRLEREGYVFPELDPAAAFSFNSSFIDSEAPPDWVDGDDCMICYTPFLVINRKHHCRACGGVFCQLHSSNTIPLVHLGINNPVRVCDNCYAKWKRKRDKDQTPALPSRTLNVGQADLGSDDDEDLKRALALSLQDSGEATRPVQTQLQPQAPPQVPSKSDDEEDEEMKAAIVASLQEFQANERAQQSARPAAPPPIDPAADFYSNMIPSAITPARNERPPVSLPQHTESQNFGYNQPYQPISAQPSHTDLGPRIPPQPSAPLDLTQGEEEKINLFITLMNTIASDPKRQANILYESNLAEMHSQIIQLKPKVNRALRLALERYEQFLDLNNKVLSISRLYDQFLEAKLEMAYGRHLLGVRSPEPTPSYVQQGQPQAQQSGIQLPNDFGVPKTVPNHTGASNHHQQHAAISPQHTFQQLAYDMRLQPSEPNFDDVDDADIDNHDDEQKIVSAQRTGLYPTENMSDPYRPTIPHMPSSEAASPSRPPRNRTDSGAYPGSRVVASPCSQPSHSLYPGYPPDTISNDPGMSDIKLPHFPPLNDDHSDLSHGVAAPQPRSFQRVTSTIPDTAVEDAEIKFPSLDNVQPLELGKNVELPVVQELEPLIEL